MDITQAIQQSDYSSSQKAELIALCSPLPQKLQAIIIEFLQRSDFSYYQEAYLHLLKRVLPALQSLLKSDEGQFRTLLAESINNPAYDFGSFMLPFVRFLLEESKKGRTVPSPDLQSLISKLYISLFRDLYDSEIRTILAQQLTQYISKIDFVYQLKRRWVLDDGESVENWSKNYLFAMENNENVIGTQSITVDGKQLPPFLKNWLKDYVTAVQALPTGRGALEEAQYFSKSPNVVKLTIEDKKTLQEVLQLYDWLMNPRGTFEELEAYDTSTNKEPASAQPAIRAPVSDIQKPRPSAGPRPQIPLPAPVKLGSPRSIQDILLDRQRPPAQLRQVRPPTSPQGQTAPSGGQVAAPDVEAKLAALRNKVQKKNS